MRCDWSAGSTASVRRESAWFIQVQRRDGIRLMIVPTRLGGTHQRLLFTVAAWSRRQQIELSVVGLRFASAVASVASHGRLLEPHAVDGTLAGLTIPPTATIVTASVLPNLGRVSKRTVRLLRSKATRSLRKGERLPSRPFLLPRFANRRNTKVCAWLT